MSRTFRAKPHWVWMEKRVDNHDPELGIWYLSTKDAVLTDEELSRNRVYNGYDGIGRSRIRGRDGWKESYAPGKGKKWNKRWLHRMRRFHNDPFFIAEGLHDYHNQQS